MIAMKHTPNNLRIGLLLSDGYTRQEAEEIDRLERRENFLLAVEAAEGLGKRLTAELTRIQDRLRRLMKERALVAESGGACRLDPEGSPTPERQRAPYAPTQTVASYAEAMRVNARHDDAVWDHEPHQPAYAYTGDSMEWLQGRKLWRAGTARADDEGAVRQPVQLDGRDQEPPFGSAVLVVYKANLRPWTNGDEREWRKRHA